MVVASRRHEMGRYVATTGQVVLGWTATIVMGMAVAAMLALMLI